MSMLHSKWPRLLAAASTLLAISATAVTAQQYPSKNITIVVPLAAGTGMDSITRIYADELQKALGRPVIVENQPGVALMLAAANVSKAEPDGHTLLVSSAPAMAVNQTLYKKINYDPAKDFVPISLYAKSPFLLIAAPSLGVNSLPEFFARAKASGDKPMNYATSGAGTIQHLTMELLKRHYSVPLDHVPYRNSNQIPTDLIGNHINSSISETGAVISLVRDNQIKALAVSSIEPNGQLAGVPTMAEATGMKDFEAVSWHALFAPAATPTPIVERLHTEMSRIAGNADFQRRVREIGLIPVAPNSRENVNKYIVSERERWGGVVKSLGLEGSM